MTLTVPSAHPQLADYEEVYAPQQDSRLLISVLDELELAGRRVADLCTGSGVVAIAAARRLASSVTGWDICPHAVACAGTNAATADVAIDAQVGVIADALAHGPYDVVTANPPYVPTPDTAPGQAVPGAGGPAWAFNAGEDGRLVLDELCSAAAGLLNDEGTLLIVQSEFAGIDDTVTALRGAGLAADVVARQRIPFGPVLSARAPWLQDTGRLTLGSRRETLAVIRADKPRPQTTPTRGG